jgi:hypothetical protein
MCANAIKFSPRLLAAFRALVGVMWVWEPCEGGAEETWVVGAHLHDKEVRDSSMDKLFVRILDALHVPILQPADADAPHTHKSAARTPTKLPTPSLWQLVPAKLARTHAHARTLVLHKDCRSESPLCGRASKVRRGLWE